MYAAFTTLGLSSHVETLFCSEVIMDPNLTVEPTEQTASICCARFDVAALTENKKMTGAAPAGGIALILGWASMALLKR